MPANVLVFPCGSEIGLEVYRSLSQSIHFNLIGGSSTEDHGVYVYEDYISGLPFVDDDSFVADINKIIKEKKIDFIIPAHDSVVLKLAEASSQGNLDCEVITSPYETCLDSRSKSRSYRLLEGVIPTPKMYSIEDLTDDMFPVFLKPDIGQGAKGTHTAYSVEQVKTLTEAQDDLLILEHLPGQEYTIDCFTNKDGELLYSEGRARSRILNGISVNSFPVDDNRFSLLAEKINQTMVFRGVWFFQVKENASGELVLMEVSPRIAGTMALSRARGVNLPLLSLFDRMDLSVEILKNDYDVTIDRALENLYSIDINPRHVYVDYDDLLIINGEINYLAIAFLYKCINKGMSIHLITKHKDDLYESLKKYRLEDIFDEVIWLKNEEEKKHNFIKEKDAIFIDDSFLERKLVKENIGIPVFDTHTIEVLLRSV